MPVAGVGSNPSSQATGQYLSVVCGFVPRQARNKTDALILTGLRNQTHMNWRVWVTTNQPCISTAYNYFFNPKVMIWQFVKGPLVHYASTWSLWVDATLHHSTDLSQFPYVAPNVAGSEEANLL